MEHVILLGTDTIDGNVIVIGLYESEAKAIEAVQSGVLPNAHYCTITTKLNSWVKPRELPVKETE